MALTATWLSVPTVTVSPNFHLGLQFSQAIDPTTLVGTDLRLRRETGQFMNPSNDDVDFYTTDNITFLVVIHASSLISATSGYLIRLPMNRIEYQDDDDNTQTGPDTTINTPEFEINPSFGDITPTITYSVSEGEVGTAVTAIATFLQPVSGVDISDFSIVDGTLGNLTVVSATEYQVEVTPIAGDGTLTLTFAEDGTYEGNAEASGDLAYTGGGQPLALAFSSTFIADQSFVVGTAVSLTLPSASGGTGTITYALSPTTPAGVSFTAGTRRLTGNPTALASETTYTYTATDGTGNSVEIEFAITVTADDITFASTIANQFWVVGTAVNLTLPSASGGVGTLTPTLSPALPSGVTFTAGTRRLSGTPTATFTSVTFTYTMTDAEGVTESITFTIVVTAPPPPVTDAVLDMSVSPSSVTAGGIATATFRFGKPVSGFTDSDVSVSAGATKGTLTDEGNNAWTLPITAPSAGSGTVTVSVGADVVSPGNNADSVQFAYTAPPPPPPMVTTPGAPTSLSLSSTHNSITANWGAPSNTGGENPSRYDIRIDGGAWIDTGLDRTHTFDSLSPNTEYTIDVAAVNSAGRGTPASGNPQRTEMPPVIVLGVPTGLKVDLKPTSAVIRWAAVDGIDGYEVSYAEGASPGTTWVATGSTGTRFFVKGLKRGTQYTFGVRGRNSAGAGAGSRPVTQNTPIASLHNALFFKECVNALDNGERVSEHGNPSNIIRAVADNNYKTFSTVRDYAIDMSRNNQPTRVDAVFIKSKGITQHSGTPTGGSGTGWTNEALPETVENWEGTHISTTVLGFQHHLLLLDQHFTATSVRVRFEGTNVEVYEILLLELLLEIDANSDFTEIAPDYVDRSAVIHPSPGGGIQRSSSLGAERQKWETNYVVKIVPGKTLLESVDEFVYQMGENPNIVHAQEPSRYPARVHPASFLLKRVPTRLRSDDKLQGDAVQFRVGEQ